MTEPRTASLLDAELLSATNLNEIFSEFDRSGSGKLPISYTPYLVKSCMLVEIPDHEIEHALATLFEKPENLTREMYFKLVSHLHKSVDKEAEMRELFNLFASQAQLAKENNKSNTGDQVSAASSAVTPPKFITTSDLAAIVAQLGEDISEAEIAEMINVADLDEDGKVDFKEFQAILSKTNLF